MGKIFFCQIVACVIIVAAFIYGAVHIFKKGTPLYQQIIMWSVSCFGIFMIASAFTTLVFEVKELEANVSYIAIFGCLCALYSANYGAMDKVVTDDSAQNTVPKTVALATSCLFAVGIVTVFLFWVNSQLLTAITFLIVYLPMVPASYYNVKHLLMPVDEMGILKNNRGVNILSLVLYSAFLTFALILFFSQNDLLIGISYIVLSAIVAAITVCAKKGIVRW